MEDYTTTEVTTYQNGVDRNRLSDDEDVVVTAFDSLDKIQNGDSDDEQNVVVTKTITTYSHNASDISATPSEHTEEHIRRIHSDDVDLTNETDWRISRVVDPNHGSYLGEFENDSHQSDSSDSETPEVHSQPGHVDDSTVNDFFTASPEAEDSEHIMRSDTEEVIRPYGGGLAVAANPSRIEDAQESDTSFHNDDNELNSDDGGYIPSPPVHSAINDSDVLITSEIRNLDDGIDDSGEVNNEFDVPEVPVETEEEAKSDPKESEESGEGGMMDTVKDKVIEVRDQGLEYGSNAMNDKLNNISDDGLMGKAKGQIVEHNVPGVAKEKITEVSDSVINDDNMIDSVKDKITSTGVLGSFGLNNETSNKDDSQTNAKAEDVAEVFSAKNVTNVESEPPTLEIDTTNALADDDMDYQLQEVDISQSNEDDFGKVFADHRQSMREGNTSPLFHQDASRFHSTGTLSNSDSKKVLKEDKVKNGSNYTINSMPTDEERPQKGCASILKGFFCPKRGSWQPDSYF